MNTFQDPPKVHAILAGLKELQLTYAKAQIEAGIDVLQISNHITADLVRPDAYTTFLHKVDREIADEISVPIMLHCCGYTLDRVELFNNNGWEGYNFESANDAREMRAKASMVLCGNINNPRTILEGTPEDVEREAFYALNAGVDILAPECAVPVNGKLANITAVREARDRYYETGRDEDRGVDLINRSIVAVRKPADSAPETAAAGKGGLSPSLKEIYDAVLEMKQGEVAPMVEAEIATGTDVQVILDKALIAAMAEVGNLFAEGIYFVPEMLMAANEMKSGLKVIRPILTETGVPPRGKVLIGTVKGDVHDIGKNLYGMMMEGAGYTVVDIGVRNSADDYIDAMEEHKPDIVGMSAMLTTTMPYMKVVIDEMAARGIRDDYIVLVGGAPLNEEFGRRVGADAYCPEAGTGVETANELLAERQGFVAAALTGTD
jgi:methanogenic corrinoid protein MtbC1